MRGLLGASVEAILWPWGIRRKQKRPGNAERGSTEKEAPAGDEGNYNWEVNMVHFLGATTGAILGWWVFAKLKGSPGSLQIMDASPSQPLGTAASAVLPRMPLSEFLRLLRTGAITTVTYFADRPPAGSLVVKGALPLAVATAASAPLLLSAAAAGAGEPCVAQMAETLLLPGCHQSLFDELRQHQGLVFECAEVGAQEQDFNWLSLLIDGGGLVATCGALWYLLRGTSQGNFSPKNLEETAGSAVDGRPKVTFEDVAGLEETKEELKEVISFLRNPQGFYALGAKPPRGLLLAGPSGTGKTLLARAVAGEANVPFFYASSAAFVEVFVGQGAQRIRQFFEQARECAPCITFLDELDAVGAARQAGSSGGNQEYAQTLNQLLIELDGVETHASGGNSEGAASAGSLVFTIAATNRYDCLDEALVRPGRLDRCVIVGLPNCAERFATLQIHARGLRAEGLDFGELARRTEGWSGADLANLLNEAALLAARRGAESVQMQHLAETLGKRRPQQRRGPQAGGAAGDAGGSSGEELFAGLLAAAAAAMQGRSPQVVSPAAERATEVDSVD